jgi:hypothetical protein
MEVCADESEIHGGSRRCVVAGFAGGRRKVVALEKRWREILSQFKIAEDIGFHAKTFFKRSASGRRFGPYEGWSDQQARDFVAQLVKAVTDVTLYPVGGGVDMQYFNSLSHNLRRWLTGGMYDSSKGKWLTSGAPNKPYFFAFQQLVIGSAQFANPGVTIDCICDRQDTFSSLAIQLWNYMKDELVWETGKHLGGIDFYSRFQRFALQAADMLAFCLHHVEAYRADTDKYEIAYVLHHIMKNGMYVKKLDSQTVELLLPGYPERLKEIDEEKQRVRELRQNDGSTAESSSQRGESRAGGRETDKAKANEVGGE